jgi:uncharacterized lipoprotein YddW (UPF0748 family)
MSFLAKAASVNVLCGLLVFLCFVFPAFGKARKNYFYYSSHAQAQKVRGVWVRPFIGATAETRKNQAKGREFIRAELEKIKRANLNTVYVEAFWNGYAMYPSRVAPQRPLAIPYGTAENGKGWDVLQTYLEEGEKLNVKIHAWLHVFHQWSTNLGDLEKSPIFAKHPDWAILDASGSPLVKSEAEGANRDIYKVFISPSNPAARKYLRTVVSELAEKYPKLAGVQWDYIRYPLHTNEQSFDYNPLTLAAFQQETDFDVKKLDPKRTPGEWKIWQDWKIRQINQTVEELAQIVRKKRPRWEISAAVFPDIEENLRVKMQDWKGWAETSSVDALLPMLYSTDYERVENWAKEFRRDVPTKIKIYPALFIGHFYNPKEKKLIENYLEIERKFKFDGYGLFAAQNLTDDLIEKLATGKR